MAAKGRPSLFTADTADEICARLSDGQSLREICRDESMPGRTTVARWLTDNEVFRGQYARAVDMRADYLFDEMLAIADTPLAGVKKTTKANGDVETSEGDMIEHRRLQVDARKWALARMAPKKYGDKHEVTGPDGGPVQITIAAADAKLL